MKKIVSCLEDKKGFICDMDGVIYHGNRILPGVREFVEWLYQEKKDFLFLTNSSERSPLELQQKLERMGLSVRSISIHRRSPPRNSWRSSRPDARRTLSARPDL